MKEVVAVGRRLYLAKGLAEGTLTPEEKEVALLNPVVVGMSKSMNIKKKRFIKNKERKV